MQPVIFPSTVTRPFLLSVDADIPDECAIDVLVEGTLSNGSAYSRVFRNPKSQPLDALRDFSFGIQLVARPDSLSCPFLYAIELEGERQKRVWLPDQLVQEDSPGNLMMIVRLPTGTSYAVPRSDIRRVYASEVQRPWVIAIEGLASYGSSLQVTVDATLADGTAWSHTFQGPCRETLPHTDFMSFRYGVHMEASPDGGYSPQLFGIAIEGDGRRFLRTAADIHADNGQETKMMVFSLPNDESVMMLAPILPQFDQPPSILDRLHAMQERGDFVPRGIVESESGL